MKRKTDIDIEKQWNEWISKNDPDKMEDVELSELRERIIKELEFVCKMEVGEYTLYQKWISMHKKFPTQLVKTLYGPQLQLKDTDKKKRIEEVKNNIWIPSDPMDYLNLKPKLVYSQDDDYNNANLLGIFVSSGARGHTNIGRNLNYVIIDEPTGKYLGVNTLSSDFLDLTARDQFIGWDRELKTMEKINHTCIGSTIVPTQPLGYNYTGGKLLALLCLADDVQKKWKEQYGDVLVGVTTTSLYGKTKTGGLSQYDRLTHWKKMGFSMGTVSYEPTKDTIKLMLQWLKKHHTRKYFEWYVATNEAGQPYKRDHRNRSYTFIYKVLDIPKELIASQHQRGIYFSQLYDNTNEFLRGEIDETQLKKSIDTSVEGLTLLWKEKYATKRIKSLMEQNRVSKETLFYDDLLYLDWPETRKKYLGDIGR